MNKDEKVKYDCKECVNYDCCSHCANGCSLFKKRVNIVLEVDGFRHVLKPDDKCCICPRCSLVKFCIERTKALCVVLGAGYKFHFELENDEG